MNSLYLDYLVSPQSYQKLILSKGELKTADASETYQVIKNVPIMLSKDTVSGWHRELMEVILWQFPEEIQKMYSEIDFSDSPVEVYLKYIKRLLHDKQGVFDALEQYAASDTETWIVKEEDHGIVSKSSLKEFKKYASKHIGKARVDSKKRTDGFFNTHPYFADLVYADKPESVVELATGAGGATSILAMKKPAESVIFTVDIDFTCLGNAIGIAKYLKCQETLLPVAANFWYLPFDIGSMDVVCTNFGLDESRENERTVSEVVRVLKQGGKFICTARQNAFMRQENILEPLGFTKEESIECLKKCRLYSSDEDLIECCGQNGLSLSKQKIFLIDDDRIAVVSEFIKD